jgi:flagellar biosynthesis protein FlhA
MARRHVARLLKPHLPETPVMSFLEIPDGKPVEVMAIVGSNNAQGAPSLPQQREMVA